MTTSLRRRLLFGLASPLLAACEGTQRAPRGDALPPPRASGPSEPAPMPSDATDDYLARRRASRTPTPTGPDAMPGFDPAQRVGTDIMMAPIPQPLPR
ncbi:MAG TPA: hypothetical protein VEX11_08385 [Acetobacteraceae bacterium]|jgi:hypothetical protein|nr:hypothetical protein [Acetobacteraceae bacterium]